MYNIKATASSLPQDASAIANLFMASISLDLAPSGRATYVQRVYVCVCGGEGEGGVREYVGYVFVCMKSTNQNKGLHVTHCTGHVHVYACTIEYVSSANSHQFYNIRAYLLWSVIADSAIYCATITAVFANTI